MGTGYPRVGKEGIRKEDGIVDEVVREIVAKGNIEIALKHLQKKKKTAPGVDGTTIDDFLVKIQEESAQVIIQAILEGTYQPQPVRQVLIPKGNGTQRTLGIPTAGDRMVQLLIAQILSDKADPQFSSSSFGFRPKKSAWQAVERARELVQTGYNWTVELDIKDFFATIDHDKILIKVKEVADECILIDLIGKFLRSGAIQGNIWYEMETGIPQGGPLSPLLANLILDGLDKELEASELMFVRYADDVNILTKTEAEAQEAMLLAINYIEEILELTINKEKSHVVRPWDTQILGFTITESGDITISGKAIARQRRNLTEITKGYGGDPEGTLSRINEVRAGWQNYSKGAENAEEVFQQIDSEVQLQLWRAKVRRIRRGQGGNYYSQMGKLGISRKEAARMGRKSAQETAEKLLTNNPGYWTTKGLY